MSVSASTARKLRVIQRQILDRPARFDMSSWADKGECGTTCCIGGYAALNAGVRAKALLQDFLKPSDVPEKIRPERVSRMFDGTPFYDVRDVAARALGLEQPENPAELFHAEEWPAGYAEAFVAAENDKTRAFIAAARIEHFIQTGA